MVWGKGGNSHIVNSPLGAALNHFSFSFRHLR